MKEREQSSLEDELGEALRPLATIHHSLEETFDIVLGRDCSRRAKEVFEKWERTKKGVMGEEGQKGKRGGSGKKEEG